MPSSFTAPSSFWPAILGRGAISPATPPSAFKEKTILITGAGGYIASRMARLFAHSGARLVLLEIAEQSLFALHTGLCEEGHAPRCTPILGSVTDPTLLTALFREHRPDLVLHAAALKHVPLMERNPFAAIATNALGTWNLVEAAAAHRTPRLILISTDKAVAPHSIMGASKRIAELITLARNFTAVRLVNVLGSPSSVGPIFADQIARGGPVTVTHPAARRYFLTLDEVAALLSEAIDARAAGLLIPDPAPPILIADLAQRMIAALAPGAAPEIAFTAPRPGDKLDESLLSPTEHTSARATPSLHAVTTPAPPHLDKTLCDLEAVFAAPDLADLLRAVQSLVPDYQPSTLLRASLPEPATAQ